MKRILALYSLLLLLFLFPQQLLAQSATPTPSCPVLPTDTGTVTLSTTISSTGLYSVWSRINPPDSLHTSYWLQIDSNCGIPVGGSPSIPVNTWTWIDYQNGISTNRVLLTLSSGGHIIRLIGKDSGVKVDRLIITDDLSCIPTGFGDNCTQAPTSTIIPITNTPIPPTLTPLPQSPTPTPTDSPQPTVTPSLQITQLSLDLLLNGIGNGGDSQSPGSSGNFQPLHPQRSITVTIEDNLGSLVTTGIGYVQFDQITGEFLGTISLPLLLSPGSYITKITSPSYLRKGVAGFLSITSSNQTSTIPVAKTTLTVGDPNNDNALDILDYNMLLDCFSITSPPKACIEETKKQATDLNDDGIINGVDINLFIRNTTVRTGD